MRRQRGQVLVIFAGGLIALMAIAALVVDLGFIFMIHRHEQNATDPGALAAARYIRYPGPGADTTKMFNAACFYARQNGYFAHATDNSNPPSASGCTPANDDMGASLVVNYPPSSAAGEYQGRPGFVEVVLTENHDSFFAGVLGIPRVPVSSAAVAAFNNGDSNSNSLVTLRPDGCSSLTVTGTGRLTIQPVIPGSSGGYIMVDDKCAPSPDGTPNACGGGPGGIDFGGGGLVTAPAAYVVGSCFKHGGAPPPSIPTVIEGAPYYADPLASLEGPPQVPPGAICPTLSPPRAMVPGDTGCQFNSKLTYTLNPGIYYGGIQVSNKPTLNFQPGIYIMAGGGFNASGGEIDSTAGDMMVYSTDVAQYRGASCTTTAPNPAAYCQGDINFNGQTTTNLSGLNEDPCAPISSTGCPYVGILFWQDGGASKALSATPPSIIINGGTSLYISGTIYNPTGLVRINGGNATNTGCLVSSDMQCAAVQIISWTVQINGNGDVTMPYDPNKLYHLDNQGLVH